MATVAIFGSRHPKPGDDLYTTTHKVGFLLAQQGYTILTGGYTGVMEAASHGAKEAGGHTIGVTVAAFEKISPTGEGRLGANPYVDEIIRFDALGERLLYVCSHADAYVAMDGGVGTLAEVAVTWNLLQAGSISKAPLLLFGSKWGDVLKLAYGDGSYIQAGDLRMYQTVNTPEEVLAVLQERKI